MLPLQMYLMRRQGKHQQPAAVAAPPVQDREPKPPRVEELLAAGSSLSDSFTSLDSRMRELQVRVEGAGLETVRLHTGALSPCRQQQQRRPVCAASCVLCSCVCQQQQRCRG